MCQVFPPQSGTADFGYMEWSALPPALQGKREFPGGTEPRIDSCDLPLRRNSRISTTSAPHKGWSLRKALGPPRNPSPLRADLDLYQSGFKRDSICVSQSTRYDLFCRRALPTLVPQRCCNRMGLRPVSCCQRRRRGGGNATDLDNHFPIPQHGAGLR